MTALLAALAKPSNQLFLAADVPWDAAAEAGGAGPPFFFLFQSALGFFFSLLLRICPFAMAIAPASRPTNHHSTANGLANAGDAAIPRSAAKPHQAPGYGRP
jgi:hypothetical protein